MQSQVTQSKDYEKNLFGSFSNDDGDGSETVTIIPTRFKREMLVKFARVELLESTPKFSKRKKNSSLCLRPP